MMRITYPWMMTGALFVAVPALSAQEVQPRLNIQAHSSGTHIVGITPDDKFLITRGDDGLKMWDLSTGKERALPKLSGRVNALSPNGKLLALADDRTVRLWDILAEKEVAAFEHDTPISAPVFSPDGKTIAAGWSKAGPKPGSRLGVGTLWDIATGKQGLTMETGPGRLSGLAFSPDGKLLAGATSDFPLIGDVTLWDVSTGKVRSTLEANGVHCLAFAPDGKTLAAGCLANYHQGKKESNHVRLWDVGTAKDRHYLRHENTVHCVAFTADSKTLASGTYYGEVKLWDVASGKERVALPRQPSYILSVAFTKDGRTLMSTRRDGVVTCWDAPKLLERPAEK
jgi:WD40 repeat protein